MQDRVRSALTTRVQSFAAWGLPRVLELLPRARLLQLLALARARTAQRPLPAPVQRFGKGLWQRAVALFPVLSELVREEDAMPRQASAPAKSAQVASIEMDGDLQALLGSLRDPSAELAAASAVILGRRREREARAALLEALRNADGYFNPLVRVAALQALAQGYGPTRDGAELAPLLDAVRDVDAEVSMAAIEAVVTHAPSSLAIERLLPVVLDDTGFFLPIVREAATRALERAGLMTTTPPS